MIILACSSTSILLPLLASDFSSLFSPPATVSWPAPRRSETWGRSRPAGPPSPCRPPPPPPRRPPRPRCSWRRRAWRLRPAPPPPAGGRTWRAAGRLHLWNVTRSRMQRWFEPHSRASYHAATGLDMYLARAMLCEVGCTSIIIMIYSLRGRWREKNSSCGEAAAWRPPVSRNHGMAVVLRLSTA